MMHLSSIYVCMMNKVNESQGFPLVQCYIYTYAATYLEFSNA